MRLLGSVDPKLLGLLTPHAAVSVLRQLLWAEASALGLGPALVTVPDSIYEPDGGVDAEVTGVSVGTSGRLLYPGFTRYQVKTGPFSASTKRDQKKLFLKPNGKEFKDRVRSCFEKNGTFVAVLFGSDAVDQTDDQTVKACRDFVSKIDPSFSGCKIIVLRQNQIAGFVEQYISISCRVQNQLFPNLRTHDQWAGELESQTALQTGPEQLGFLEQVRKELRQGLSRHVCVWGDPGVGKTRLLYEATAQDDLSALVAYFRSPAALEASGAIDELVRSNDKSALIVVDDCEARDRGDIWNRLKSLGSRVRLVTIQHDPFDATGSAIGIPLPPLAEEQISAIIQQNGIPKDVADRFAPLCGGSPRVADIAGWNLRRNPQDLTRLLATGNLWDPYLVGPDDPGSPGVLQRIRVLQYIALFKKFGFGGPFASESAAIAERLRAADPGVTLDRFREIIYQLRQRHILQGETTLYITPRLLHIKLWCDWWAIHGAYFSLESFLKDIPESLHTWFYEMFAYAHGSKAAMKAVGAILSKHGVFVRDGLVKTELGANFFLRLTEADTESALQCLEATIGRDPPTELRRFTDGRQRIVWALEKIAVERALFARAATLLLRLAEAESEPGIGNNATGTFAGLFSLAPGRTAPTQAPPRERFPILQSALHSNSPERRAIALRACDQALNFGHFSRTVGAERRGLLELDLWSPQTYGEWWEAYERVWKLLADRVATLPDTEQPEAAAILLKHCSGLVRIPKMRDLILETMASLAHNPRVSLKKLVETILFVLKHSEDLPEDTRERWRQLEATIAGGDDFPSRLKRFVCLPPWEYHRDVKELDLGAFARLASEIVDNPRLLLSVLEWLFSSEAESSGLLGSKLGEMDKSLTLKDMIIAGLERAGEAANCSLLGAYLLGVRQADRGQWLSIFKDLADRPSTAVFVPQLLMFGGLNDDTGEILKRLVEKGVLPANRLGGFIYGGQIRELSLPSLESWLNLLLSEGTQDALTSALQLLEHYVLGRAEEITLPARLVESILLHRTFFEEETGRNRGSHMDYAWVEVARWLFERQPGRRLAFARVLLKSMGKDTAIMGQFGHSYTHGLLQEIAKSLPSEVWAIASPFLGPPLDSRSFSIRSWLQGESFLMKDPDETDSVLSYVPLEDLWHWVDEDVENRAWYLASFAPKNLIGIESRPSLFREILIRYGDREDVRGNLRANYLSGGFMGPESTHHESQRQRLIEILDKESEPRVREWLNQCVQTLERSASRARLQEEREDS